MDAFKERVSHGTANLGAAKLFLSTQYRLCLASPAATPRAAIQSSGAASVILRWLWSSGIEDTGEFLMDQAFVTLLVPFLVAEGHHSQIWRWLYRCSDRGDPAFSNIHGPDTYRLQGFLFVRLIKEEIKNGDGLESAITLFLRIVGRLWSSKPINSAILYDMTSGAWILTLRILKAAEPEPSNLQSFADAIRKFLIDPRLRATTYVFFQKPPNPQPALLYFQNASVQAIEKISANRRPHVVLLGLRAAELFLDDGRQTEALWIMDFLQENFARELGTPPPRVSRISSFDERKSLHLLDTLAVS